MKAIINFRDKTVTTEDGNYCNFYEAGVYYIGSREQELCYPLNIEEFEDEGYKENMQNKGYRIFEYEDK